MEGPGCKEKWQTGLGMQEPAVLKRPLVTRSVGSAICQLLSRAPLLRFGKARAQAAAALGCRAAAWHWSAAIELQAIS